MPQSPRIQLLSDEQFWATYLPLGNINDPTADQKKEVYEELGLLDGILRPALDARWGKTDAYYEVSDDWNICWKHSMAVCSDQMCCAEFVDIVKRALAQMTHDWCFHVSLQCNEDMGWGLQHAGYGAIFFHRGEIYGNRDDQFNYALFDA